MISKRLYLLPAFILAAVLCLAGPAERTGASTAEPRWTRVEIPAEGEAGGWTLADGSDVRHPTLAADGTLYACGKGLTYSFYKSEDGGKSWTSRSNVTDSIVDIAAPDEAGAVYYATSAAVYRSEDGGDSFELLRANPGGAGSGQIEITSLDVTRLENRRLVAVGTRDTDSGEYGGVYTLDEGEVIPGWTDTGAGSYDVYAVAFSPNYASDRQITAVVTDETETRAISKAGSNGWGAITGDAVLGA